MKKDRTIVRKSCIMLIAVCCLLSLILSDIYIAQNGSHINHKHSGQEECSVCVNICHVNGLLQNIKLVSGSSGFISVCAAFFLISTVLVRTQIFTNFTLVKMKTRLDN